LLERRAGLVQATALSSLRGGISMAQLREVQEVPGVEVAAPLAVFGQVVEQVPITVPIDRPAGRRSVHRVRVRWTADNGLSRIQDPPSYTYVTPRSLTPGGDQLLAHGQQATAGERLPNGDVVPVCPFERSPEDAVGPFSPIVRARVDCWSARTGLSGLAGYVPDAAADRVGATVRFAFAMPIVGIDPAAEARLSGLNRARTTGRFLTADDGPRLRNVGIGRMDIPVVLSEDLPSSIAARVQVVRLPDTAAARIPTITDARALRRILARAPARASARTTVVGAGEAYRRLLTALRTRDSQATWPDALWTVGPVRYRALGGRHVQAIAAPPQDDAWVAPFVDDGSAGFLNPPITAADVGFRRLTERLVDRSARHPVPTLRVVGLFSPRRAPQANAVLDPFSTSALAGATASTRNALHNRPLTPNGNPAGLVGLPPVMLTTLAARKVLFNETYVDGGGARSSTPLALIRVRVAGVHGADATSRERIRLVADRIRQRTGLDVDITAGASPTTVRVDAPAGRFGRPALALSDPWVLKGVAVAVLNAVDRKSVLLFSLVLLVCVLFCLSAAAAAVRQRTTELAILACVGWRRRSLLRLLLGEISILGIVAGLVGLAIAVPVGAAFGVPVTTTRAAAAVPAAALICVAAALVPLLRATRADPLNAVRPPARASRRRGSAASIGRLAVANTLAVPGRALLGALSLAIGVLALTLLLAVTVSFRGAVVGTVLGNTVSVQVRSIDYVSVGVTLVLGVLGLTDVLYLNVRDRAAELAALRATGWPETALGRMVALEGLLIGAAGGAAGAAVGLLAARLFTDSAISDLLVPAALGVVVGAVCAAAAAVAPVLALRRLPTARLLAEE
jgi:hypothetical protein